MGALEPARELLPYDLVVPFWSEGATKSRFVAIPEGKVSFSPTGEWAFPPGTVFVKTFELPVDAAQPQRTQRLETRLLVVDRSGGVYGTTYKWRADLSDAELLPPEGLNEDIAIRDAGGTHAQTWYYPSRKDCLVCHNSHTPGVLGPKTRQMNRDLRYADGTTENQLRRWNRLELFSPALDEKDIGSFATLARATDHEPQPGGPRPLVSRCRLRALPAVRAEPSQTSMRATRRRWRRSSSSMVPC